MAITADAEKKYVDLAVLFTAKLLAGADYHIAELLNDACLGSAGFLSALGKDVAAGTEELIKKSRYE
jgi:hypothetical protein